jgi:hypothetical protein
MSTEHVSRFSLQLELEAGAADVLPAPRSCSLLRQGGFVSDSSSKMAVAETASAIAAGVGLFASGGSRLAGWLVHRTKTTDALAQHRSDVMARFDRFERWCARVDVFMMRYSEHRIADERFMARSETALAALGQRIGRVERVQDGA